MKLKPVLYTTSALVASLAVFAIASSPAHATCDPDMPMDGDIITCDADDTDGLVVNATNTEIYVDEGVEISNPTGNPILVRGKESFIVVNGTITVAPFALEEGIAVEGNSPLTNITLNGTIQSSADGDGPGIGGADGIQVDDFGGAHFMGPDAIIDGGRADVTNNGVIDIFAGTEPFADGIIVFDDRANITNNGLIHVDGAYQPRGITANGQNNAVLNPGTIEIVSFMDGIGVAMQGNGSFIINDGEISVIGNGAIGVRFETNGYGAPIGTRTNGVNNNGLIEVGTDLGGGAVVEAYAVYADGGFVAVNNTGTIDGGQGGDGILYRGNENRLFNSGLITSAQQPFDPGRDFAPASVSVAGIDNLLINYEEGVIERTGESAIAIGIHDNDLNGGALDGVNTIQNMGLIMAETAILVSEKLDGKVSVDLENDGEIKGDVLLGSANDTILNSGSIIGDVDLAGGDDSFTLTDTGTVMGVVMGGAGTDFLSYDGTANGAFDASMFTGFEDFEFFNITNFDFGSEFTFSEIEINEGELNLTGGMLNGSVTLSENTLLDGTGTIIGNVTSAGMVAPGNSPGTITIDGNFTQGATGVLELEVAASGASDLLDISGTATLNGTVEGILLDDVTDYTNGQMWTVLTADGGISGDYTYDSPFDADSFYQLNAEVVMATMGESLQFQFVRDPFVSAADTANRTSFATALDDMYDGLAAGDTRDLLVEIAGAGKAAAPNTFDQLTPSGVAHIPTAVLAGRRAVLSGVTREVTRDIREGGQAFAFYSYTTGDMEGNANSFAYDYSASNIVAGFSYGVTDKVELGLAAGRTMAEVDEAGFDNEDEMDGTDLMGFAAYKGGALDISGVTMISFDNYDHRRPYAAGTLSGALGGSTDGTVFSARFDMGYSFMTGGAVIRPGAYVVTSGVQADTFIVGSETGVGLRVDETNLRTTQIGLGAGIGQDSAGNEGRLSYNLQAYWQFDLRDRMRTTTAAFTASQFDSFTYVGTAADNSALLLDAMVGYELGNGLLLSGGYQGFFGSRESSHNLRIALGLRW